MQVSVRRESPSPPPIDMVTISLSPGEAGRLMDMLYIHEYTGSGRGLFSLLENYGVERIISRVEYTFKDKVYQIKD